MIPAIEPYVFSDAVRTYWTTLERQMKAQDGRGISDTGTRTKVTGGQQMNGFSTVLLESLVALGTSATDIYIKGKRDLPGFFRPHKEWDIVIVSDKKLIAAIELKSQVGPSFGNNFNNRTEEALGSAADFWTAFRENTFGASPQPWLGYLFLLEDCPETHKPVGVREPYFPVRREFVGASYAKRYEMFCRKLVLERHYSSACMMLSDASRAEQRENYSEPAEDLSAAQFLTQLLSHVYTRLQTKKTT